MFRRWFGVPYWSLSQWAKLKVKNAVNYIGAFEQTLAAEARRHDADGVICGHIDDGDHRDERHPLHELRRLWRAAPRWPNTRTAVSKSSPGSNRRAGRCWISPDAVRAA